MFCTSNHYGQIATSREHIEHICGCPFAPTSLLFVDKAGQDRRVCKGQAGAETSRPRGVEHQQTVNVILRLDRRQITS